MLFKSNNAPFYTISTALLLLFVAPWVAAEEAQNEYAFLLNLDEDQEQFYPSSWAVSLEFNDTGIDGEEDLRQEATLSKAGLFGTDDYMMLVYETDAFEDFHGLTLQYESVPFVGDWFVSIESSYTQQTLKFEEETVETLEDKSTELGLYAMRYSALENGVMQWGLGARWYSVDTDNATVYENSHTNDFFLPGLKLFIQKDSSVNANSTAYLAFEWNEPSMADTKSIETTRSETVEVLGQQGVINLELSADIEKRFQILSAGYGYEHRHSYAGTIEGKFKLDVSGQYSFDDYLLPQFQRNVGGLYSVRGYDDQVLSGSRVLEAKVEYHWLSYEGLMADAIVSAWVFLFFDWANIHQDNVLVTVTSQFDRISGTSNVGELSETIYSAGLGVELFHHKQSTFYLAWGHALADAGVDTEKGDDRLHAYLRINF